jgi:hypothetical protein
MDKLEFTIACASFLTMTLASAQDHHSLPSAQSTDFLYDSGPSAMESFWTGALRWADAPDPAGLTRHIRIAHAPYFDLGPPTPTPAGDYLFGPRGAGHPSFRAQGPGRDLRHASAAPPDVRPSWSGTRNPESEPLSTQKGTTSHFASCAGQAQPWPGPEGPHTDRPQHGNSAPAAEPRCTPRYLSSLY